MLQYEKIGGRDRAAPNCAELAICGISKREGYAARCCAVAIGKILRRANGEDGNALGQRSGDHGLAVDPAQRDARRSGRSGERAKFRKFGPTRRTPVRPDHHYARYSLVKFSSIGSRTLWLHVRCGRCENDDKSHKRRDAPDCHVH